MNKTEWHFWTIDQYNEEEQWLNKKAQEGWALTDAFAVRYVFRPCQPGEYVYKIIFTDGIKGSQERDDFTAFLEENGIEEVGRFHRWAYYRKKNDGTPFEIYNSKGEELAHLNKVRNLAKTLLVIIAICWVMELGAILHNPYMAGAFTMVTAVACMVIKVYKGLTRKAKALEKEISLFE